MATNSEASALFTLQPDELVRLKKRREDVSEYDPPKWTSNQEDVVSGQLTQTFMVEHASILHAGAVSRARLTRD